MPEKLDYSLPEEIDMQVRDAIPDLFSGKYKSVLYVGANHLRQHFLPDFVKYYQRITVIEVFERNVTYLKEHYGKPNVDIIRGDVRNVGDLVRERFDICFFWHGPEHLERNEIAGMLSTLEQLTNHIVILGMPYGHYMQGPEYENVHESHMWDIYPEDMEAFGYRTDTIGKPDDTLSNMMAWKRL